MTRKKMAEEFERQPLHEETCYNPLQRMALYEDFAVIVRGTNPIVLPYGAIESVTVERVLLRPRLVIRSTSHPAPIELYARQPKKVSRILEERIDSAKLDI